MLNKGKWYTSCPTNSFTSDKKELLFQIAAMIKTEGNLSIISKLVRESRF